MSSCGLDFDSLKLLHNAVNDLLHSPNTKHEIIQHGHEKWAHNLSESSLKMADSCASAKDLLILAKDHLKSLQSTFRRIPAKHDHEVGNSLAPYRLPRKQLKKAILKRLSSLKAMKTTCNAGSIMPEDQTLTVVINMLNEVRATVVLIVRTLLSLIAMPNPDGKQKSSRRDPIFRIKLTRVDSLSYWEKCTLSDVRTVMKQLEEVELVIDEMETELEQAIKEKLNDMSTMRKAKAEAREEEKAEKDLAKARIQVAHEVRLAREAEAAMALHANKAAEKVVEDDQKIPHLSSSEGAVHGGYNPNDSCGSNCATNQEISPTLSTDTVYDSTEAGHISNDHGCRRM